VDGVDAVDRGRRGLALPHLGHRGQGLGAPPGGLSA